MIASRRRRTQMKRPTSEPKAQELNEDAMHVSAANLDQLTTEQKSKNIRNSYKDGRTWNFANKSIHGNSESIDTPGVTLTETVTLYAETNENDGLDVSLPPPPPTPIL